MDTIKSFKGYGKVDELEERAFWHNTRKRLLILIVLAIVLMAVIIAAVAGTVIHNRNAAASDEIPPTPTSPAASIKAVCSVTHYPDLCVSSIQKLESTNSTTDPEEIFKISLQVVLSELLNISSLPNSLMLKIHDDRVKAALSVCQTIIDNAIDRTMDGGKQDEKILSAAAGLRRGRGRIGGGGTSGEREEL
ncbi:pectinesterase [Sarracenia purpurea var. burkii]